MSPGELHIGWISESAREFARIRSHVRSEDGRAGRILLVTVIGLQLFQVWLNVRFNAWYKTFYDALQNKDWDISSGSSAYSACSPLPSSSAPSISSTFSNGSRSGGGAGSPTKYLGRWLGDGTHYRMRLKGNSADNPDQRIADDIKLFINSTLDIGIALLGSIVTLISFVVILWGLSSSFPLVIGSQSFNIPGYLVWAA